jgi:hypothetical protein
MVRLNSTSPTLFRVSEPSSLEALRVISITKSTPKELFEFFGALCVKGFISGEAEWKLDTLEELFEFYLVRPAAPAKRKAALNLKLPDARNL